MEKTIVLYILDKHLKITKKSIHSLQIIQKKKTYCGQITVCIFNVKKKKNYRARFSACFVVEFPKKKVLET